MSYGYVTAVGGGDSQVKIRREMTDENGFAGADNWDPMVDLTFFAEPGQLHADCEPSSQRIGIDPIRVTDLYRLLDGLTLAVETGVRLGFLPARLTDQERGERWVAASDIRDAIAAAVSPTNTESGSPVLAGEQGEAFTDEGDEEDEDEEEADDDDEDTEGYDAGDVWKKDTRYDHTLEAEEGSD